MSILNAAIMLFFMTAGVFAAVSLYHDLRALWRLYERMTNDGE